jgi:hypothetical protein
MSIYQIRPSSNIFVGLAFGSLMQPIVTSLENSLEPVVKIVTERSISTPSKGQDVEHLWEELFPEWCKLSKHQTQYGTMILRTV